MRDTTNPAPCCHLCHWLVNASPLLPPSECNWLWAMAGDNKLTFDPQTRLPELTHNLIRSSHGHSTPSLKISCKSVQPFSRNLADKETKKQRNKERNRAKTIPRPPTGGGVNSNVSIILANEHSSFAGSAATYLKWGGGFYSSLFCTSSQSATVKRIITSACYRKQ